MKRSRETTKSTLHQLSEEVGVAVATVGAEQRELLRNCLAKAAGLAVQGICESGVADVTRAQVSKVFRILVQKSQFDEEEGGDFFVKFLLPHCLAIDSHVEDEHLRVFAADLIQFVQSTNSSALGRAIMPLASRVIELGMDSCYPVSVGGGVVIQSSHARLNFIRIFGMLLPLLRCPSEDARCVMNVLSMLGMGASDRWRWFVAIVPHLALSFEDTMFLWNLALETDWDPSGVELVAVVSRIFVASPSSLRPILVSRFPADFTEKILQHQEGELFLQQVESNDVRAICQRWALEKSPLLESIPRFFKDVHSFSSALVQGTLPLGRRLMLTAGFNMFGSSVPLNVVQGIGAQMVNVRLSEPDDILHFVRMLLRCTEKKHVEDILVRVPFIPQYIPIFLKFGLVRPSIWGEDMDALFSHPNPLMTREVLLLMAPHTDPSMILVAFARGKRRMTPTAFVCYLESIASFKHSPSTLTAINSSASNDARAAALTLWHNSSISSWEGVMGDGVQDGTEGCVWALGVAARLHKVPYTAIASEWPLEMIVAVVKAISMLHQPLTFCIIANVMAIVDVSREGLVDPFSSIGGSGESLSSLGVVTDSSEDGCLREIVAALADVKRPSQGFGLASTAAKMGMEMGKIPQLLGRVRSSLILHVLFSASFCPDTLTLAVSLSFCEGDPKGWGVMSKRQSVLARSTLKQMALEILDKLAERLGKRQSSLKEALVFRAIVNLIDYLGGDVQNVANKIQGIVFSRRTSSLLHFVILEASHRLIGCLGTEYLLARGDSILADYIDTLPLLCSPESYRMWISGVALLRSKSGKAVFWRPVLSDSVLPLSILSAVSDGSHNSTESVVNSIELLGSASHTYRRIILSSLISQFRAGGFPEGVLQSNSSMLMRNLIECVQIPILSSLAAEVLGVLGPFGGARAHVTPSRTIEDSLGQALDWRKFALATLGQHCPSAMEAASNASAHDQIAFAVQEVIKSGCEEERRGNGKVGPLTRSELDTYGWWSQLSSKQCDRYQVFLTTNYSIPKSNPPSSSDPVFMSGMPVGTWCRLLSRALAYHAKESFRRLFKATRALAVADRNRMFDLLPLFTLHFVLHATDGAAFVANEINMACSAGDREHVMVALSLVDILQRAANRITLSDKLSKFRLKEVDEFPFGGRVQSALTVLDQACVLSAAVRFGFDSHALRLMESSRSLPSVSKLRHEEITALKKAFSNLYDPYSVRAVRELAPPVVATAEDLELENDFDGSMRFANGILLDCDPSGIPQPLLLCFARSAEMLGQSGSSMALLERQRARSDEVQHHLNEAAWRLGRWDDVAPVQVPGLSTSVRAMVHQECSQVSTNVLLVSKILSSMLSHFDSVPDKYLVLLSGLEDVRFMEQNRSDPEAVSKYLTRRMNDSWSYRNPEPLCSLHSLMYKLMGVQNGLGELWLGQSRHALQREDFDGAITAARRVGSLGLRDEYHTEMATILSKMGRKTEAIQFALHSVSNVSPECASRLKARSAFWGHELNFHSAGHTASLLADAVRQHGAHESFELLGLFHYQMFSNARATIEAVGGSQGAKEMHRTMETHALPGMTAFSKAVALNPKHIMEAMPRLVTLWLDGNSTLYQVLKDGRLRGHDPDKITSDTSAIASRIPPSFFLASVGHLLSRLSTSETALAVSGLLVKLLQAYPQPLLWQILAAGLSAPSNRASTIQSRILTPFVEGGGREALSHFRNLFACLTNICRGTIPGNRLGGFDPVRKLVPILPLAKFAVPSIASLHPSYSPAACNFFFHPSPHIYSFGDQVDVINSLQKPKRIVIVDSGGRSRFYLMKAKDDPRKDIRMMEIATYLNNVFLKGSVKSSDALSLQCYAVMALCDDCALIEWVDGTATIRRILDETYTIDGTGVKIPEVQTWKEACDKNKFSKMDLFKKYIFPASPPVLHQWFQRSFAHTLQWYRARSLYTQSCAVWSMCGHIVGLGDRHAENLLVSLESGQAMHVDFACMFDKGETLRVPETVRFRLTPNVVDGFGITGTNGPFTNCCERAISVLGENKDIVEGVLETFIYDPLLEWSSKDGKTDPKALIRRCKRRLDGYMDFYGSPRDEFPLSVSGQVRALINHNAKLEVLSEMYIWWMVWL